MLTPMTLDDGHALAAPKMPHPSLAERARVRGFGSLGVEELLALLWSGEAADGRALAAAQDLTREVPLWRLSGMRVPELSARDGIGERRALRLLCALELGQRSVDVPVLPRVRLATPEDVAAVVAPRMAALARERVVALLVDRRQRLLAEVVVSEGWSEGAPVDPREVFRPALGERAGGVVLVHNHPSGDPTPSSHDRDLTRRLKLAGDAIGIRLVDHVVVAAGGHASLAREGLC